MAILGTPADVIKTRIMNQPTENGRYLSLCAVGTKLMCDLIVKRTMN